MQKFNIKSHGDAIFVCKNIETLGTLDDKLKAIDKIFNREHIDTEDLAGINKHELSKIIAYLEREFLKIYKPSDNEVSDDDLVNVVGIKGSNYIPKSSTGRNPRCEI